MVKTPDLEGESVNKQNEHTCSVQFLGETLTMVAWLTMVNHGWTMVNHGWTMVDNG